MAMKSETHLTGAENPAAPREIYGSNREAHFTGVDPACPVKQFCCCFTGV